MRGWSPQFPVLAPRYGQCGPVRRMPDAVTGRFEQMKGEIRDGERLCAPDGWSLGRRASKQTRQALLLSGQLRYRDIALDIERS